MNHKIIWKRITHLGKVVIKVLVFPNKNDGS